MNKSAENFIYFESSLVFQIEQSTYVCMYVCIYVYMYVCIYVCMYMYVCMYIHTFYSFIIRVFR